MILTDDKDLLEKKPSRSLSCAQRSLRWEAIRSHSTTWYLT